MTNAEQIKALRYCAQHEGCDYYIAKDCPRGDTWVCGADCEQILMIDAADALEAADKRIAELEAQEPTEKQVVDYCHKRCLVIVEEELFQRMKATFSLMPKRGEWIEKWRFKTDGTPFHKIGDMECSVCHGDMLGRYYSKYCPHCGALLRGEHDEQIH